MRRVVPCRTRLLPVTPSATTAREQAKVLRRTEMSGQEGTLTRFSTSRDCLEFTARKQEKRVKICESFSFVLPFVVVVDGIFFVAGHATSRCDTTVGTWRWAVLKRQHVQLSSVAHV